MPSAIEIKARIRRRLVRIIARCEELVRDGRWWNANRVDEEPIDFGAKLAILPLANDALEALDLHEWAEFERRHELLNATVRESYAALGIDQETLPMEET